MPSGVIFSIPPGRCSRQTSLYTRGAFGIVDLEKARKPMYTTGDSERSGMGFTIMESFMTYFSVSSEVGKGTCVHMRRKLQRRK